MPLLQRSIGRAGQPQFGEFDEDIYSIPAAEEEAEFQAQQDARPDGTAPSSLSRMKAAGDRQAQHEAARPRVSDFKPKGWQRALAAGANFGAGYVNAGGRVKVDSGAMQNINNSLLRPGLQRAQEKWQDDGAGVDAEMRGATRDYQIESAQTRQQQDAARAKAYGDAQGASASLNRRREAKLNEPPPPFINSPLGPISSSTGELINKPTPKPVPETPTEAQGRRAKEIESGQFKSLTPEQQDAYVLTGRIPRAPAPPRQGTGRAPAPRTATRGQFQGVENKKQDRLGAAENAHRKRIQDGMPEPESLKILEQQKQQAMSGYDAGVETLGGSVAPRAAQPPAAAPPPNAGAPAAPKKYTEAEVRNRAIQRGQDPNMAVDLARKNGLL